MDRLARKLGIGALIFYGIGDILGAGIYSLVGKVIGQAGSSAWVSFLLSAALAAITGLAYAELTSRVPKSAGVAAFSAAAFQRPFLTFIAGYFILLSGIASASTVALAFHGYLSVFLPSPQWAAALGLLALASLINFWGIHESARVNNALTLVEVAGLLLIVAVGWLYGLQFDSQLLWMRLRPALEWSSILAGATLAFYAFVGFEDLANLAEECKDPQRDLPRAILISVAVTCAMYLAIVCVALWTLNAQEAAQSLTPLLDILKKSGIAVPAGAFAVVALLAVCNTGLANLIMASRLLYGMADQGILPAPLARVHASRHTPALAILAAFALCAALVLTGGVQILAQVTSLVLVCAFTIVHSSLIVLRKKSSEPAPFRAPGFVPYAGIAGCALLASRFPPAAYARVGILLAIGALLYFGLARKTKVAS